MSNTHGTLFKLTTFGESHGAAIGGVIDGCPSGLLVDFDFLRSELQRRKPGQSEITTQRKEDDEVEILSGVFEGKTLGTPIGFIIRNKDQKSKDYEQLKDVYRPGHADFVYEKKYGMRDYRGGGRSSARETACRVVAGAFAKMILQKHNISITAFVQSVKDVEVTRHYSQLDFSVIEKNAVRCADAETAKQMIAAIEKAKADRDSVGGTIICVCKNVPVGLGEPIYNKLDASLASAMLSINATKGFEMLDGFASTRLYGSENNLRNDGITAGISNGEDVAFRVAFKPTSTIAKAQQTINSKGDEVTLEATGRHDPCVLPRAVPVVEAMAALVLVDFLQMQYML
ncbi:MAG: chorismate synthase [Flavobacteriales bacterium]